jgi:hypothetical protein
MKRGEARDYSLSDRTRDDEGCPKIEMVCGQLYNLETTCVDVKISLARERYV